MSGGRWPGIGIALSGSGGAAFVRLGTLDDRGSSYETGFGSNITNVLSGNLIVACVWRMNISQLTTVSGNSGAVSFIKLSHTDNAAGWGHEVWAALSPSDISFLTVASSFSGSSNYGGIVTALYSGVTSITPRAVTWHDADGVGEAPTSTDRYAQSMSVTGGTLLLAAGADLAEYRTHTAQNGFTKRIDCNTFGTNTTSVFLFDRVASTGTYGGTGSGNRFSVASATDIFMSHLVALPC